MGLESLTLGQRFNRRVDNTTLPSYGPRKLDVGPAFQSSRGHNNSSERPPKPDVWPRFQPRFVQQDFAYRPCQLAEPAEWTPEPHIRPRLQPEFGERDPTERTPDHHIRLQLQPEFGP